MNRPPFGQGHESLLHIHLICSGTADPADFSTRSCIVGELVSVNYGTGPPERPFLHVNAACVHVNVT
jgi:hypothetical protein